MGDNQKFRLIRNPAAATAARHTQSDRYRT